MASLEQIRKDLECARFIEHADEINGYTRAQTALIYPDGSSIDVFFKLSDQATQAELTDLGTTVGWLMDMGIQTWTTSRRRDQVQSVLDAFDAGQKGAEIVVTVRPGEALASAIIRLSQACARVSDLYLTKRQQIAQFRETVEELVSAFDFSYEARKELKGVEAKVTVDLLVDGPNQESAVLCIDPTRQAVDDAAHKWYDLRDRGEQKLTVYNDTQRELERSYMQYLTREGTLVLPYTQQDAIREVLNAVA